MKKCRFDCMTCPYVQTGKTVVANSSNYKHDIENQVDCQTANVIYCLSCNKCKEQYIGETENLYQFYSDNTEVMLEIEKLINLLGNILTNQDTQWKT